MRTIFDHAISTGTVPSLNIPCMSRTTSFHIIHTVSFSLLAYLRHPFKSSALVPDGPPYIPVLRPRTSISSSAFVGTSSMISVGWNNIVALSLAGGRHL